MLESPRPSTPHHPNFNTVTSFIENILDVYSSDNLEQCKKTIDNHEMFNDLLNYPEDIKRLAKFLFNKQLLLITSENKLYETHFRSNFKVLQIQYYLICKLKDVLDRVDKLTCAETVLLKLLVLINLSKTVFYYDKLQEISNTKQFLKLLDTKKSLLNQADGIYRRCEIYIKDILEGKKEEFDSIYEIYKEYLPSFMLLRMEMKHNLCALHSQLQNYNLFQVNSIQFHDSKNRFDKYLATHSDIDAKRFEAYHSTTKDYAKSIEDINNSFPTTNQRQPAKKQKQAKNASTKNKPSQQQNYTNTTATQNKQNQHKKNQNQSPSVETLCDTLQNCSLTTDNFNNFIETYKKNPVEILHAIYTYQDWSSAKHQAIVNCAQYIPTIDFRAFLNYLSILFHGSHGADSLRRCSDLGVIRFIALGIGADWFEHFQTNSAIYQFIQSRLENLIHIQEDNSVYILAILLMANVDKELKSLVNPNSYYEFVITLVIDQFFRLYESPIDANTINKTTAQLKNLLINDLCPSFRDSQQLTQPGYYEPQPCFTPFYQQLANINPEYAQVQPQPFFVPYRRNNV